MWRSNDTCVIRVLSAKLQLTYHAAPFRGTKGTKKVLRWKRIRIEYWFQSRDQCSACRGESPIDLELKPEFHYMVLNFNTTLHFPWCPDFIQYRIDSGKGIRNTEKKGEPEVHIHETDLNNITYIGIGTFYCTLTYNHIFARQQKIQKKTFGKLHKLPIEKKLRRALQVDSWPLNRWVQRLEPLLMTNGNWQRLFIEAKSAHLLVHIWTMASGKSFRTIPLAESTHPIISGGH